MEVVNAVRLYRKLIRLELLEVMGLTVLETLNKMQSGSLDGL